MCGTPAREQRGRLGMDFKGMAQLTSDVIQWAEVKHKMEYKDLMIWDQIVSMKSNNTIRQKVLLSDWEFVMDFKSMAQLMKNGSR